MSVARIISSLVQRQIERGFVPHWRGSVYVEDYLAGRAWARQGRRCPRWQTQAFRDGHRATGRRWLSSDRPSRDPLGREGTSTRSFDLRDGAALFRSSS